MIEGFPFLSFLTFLPLAGVAAILLFTKRREEGHVWWAKAIALGTSLATFGASLLLFKFFDPSVSGFQLIEKFNWIPSLSISYHKGIDGISFWFVLLSSLLSTVAILSGFEVKERVRGLMIALLVLETIMIGMFTSLDFFLFYVFFEGVLIPMFLVIGIWGGENRVYAATKFFLFTLLGSVLMLVGIFAMALHLGTSDMTAMIGADFPREMGLWLWLVFFASFAVKTPMWPLHTWLPHAHVEAPTAGSVLLAGVLLKMGGYGFLRVSLQMLPEASAFFSPMMIALSLIAVVYASLVALAQTDMKKLVAYSSVAHMGFVTLGLFSGREQGVEGAIMIMLSHGFVAAALFLIVGVLYSRLHTREIARYGGVAVRLPFFAAYAMVFTLASLGLPGTSGFVGEFMSLHGAWHYNKLVAAGAALGIILGAAYMLWLYRRVFLGSLDKEDVKAMPRLTLREYAMLTPLLILVLWMGLHPASFRDIYAPEVSRIEGLTNPLPSETAP